MQIAFFDFDGTITRKDSFLDFVWRSAGAARFAWGLVALAPTLVAYRLRLVSNHRAKERVLAHFFAGLSRGDFAALGERYSRERIERIVRPQALARIAWHQQNGHKVVVVSASPEDWLRPWCEALGVELLATRLATADGVITGKLAGANCYGEEKARRIRENYDLSAFERIYAYGDSAGDAQMLALADEKYYKPFR